MTVMHSRPVTTQELLAMPDDGMERELSHGVLKERPVRSTAGRSGQSKRLPRRRRAAGLAG
jgi:hypothetical protein